MLHTSAGISYLLSVVVVYGDEANLQDLAIFTPLRLLYVRSSGTQSSLSSMLDPVQKTSGREALRGAEVLTFDLIFEFLTS